MVIPSLNKCAIAETQHTLYIQNTKSGHPKKSSRHPLLFLVKSHIIDEKERLVRRMRNFDYSNYQEKSWDVEIVNYLSAIHEARGKQTLFLRQKEDTLNRLVEIAKIQSTEASNAIEGICTTETRLKQLISEKTTPRNRDEKEILGYRDALNVVHESFEYIPITPNYILQLHKIMFSHTDSSFDGQFKNVQNYISATDAQGNRFILFTPLTPFETPAAMQSLCDSYNMAIGEGIVDPLLLIPVFIHDFLCIHPFIDGNGRMSRLLTTLLLYRSGYYVGRYISLEAKIAKNKDFYYDALQQSQTGWHEGNDDPTPFIKYMLGTVISAYRDFEDRVELVGEKLPSIDIVRSAIRQKIGKFKKTDVLELCPSLSATSVERSLKALCRNGEISKHGNGKSTYYLREAI
jgi:Fic family protein